nr:hypothetical protein [Tanacetum cinerariifolium]
MISTTLALSITPPNTSQTLLSQPIEPSPIAPRALTFSSPPTSPHLYLNNIEDLPPRSTNSQPFPLFDQTNNQTLHHFDPMKFEHFFSPTNLSRRNRLCAQPKPFMSKEQSIEEIGKLQDLSHDIETALYNAQNVQNGLVPHTTTTISQMLLPSSYPTTTFQPLQTSTIPPFRPILPPP